MRAAGRVALASIQPTCHLPLLSPPPPRPARRFRNAARYYGLLLSLSRRFPFASLEPWDGVPPMPISIKFVWTDLFASGLFAKKKIGTLGAHTPRAPSLGRAGPRPARHA